MSFISSQFTLTQSLNVPFRSVINTQIAHVRHVWWTQRHFGSHVWNYRGWILWRNTQWQFPFVMNPEDDPLKAKQETLKVPSHPLLIPYFRRQGVTVKSTLSNIYFGQRGTQTLADMHVHPPTRVLSIRWHHIMMSRTTTQTTCCRNALSSWLIAGFWTKQYNMRKGCTWQQRGLNHTFYILYMY